MTSRNFNIGKKLTGEKSHISLQISMSPNEKIGMEEKETELSQFQSKDLRPSSSSLSDLRQVT